jgi:hypothetical protein
MRRTLFVLAALTALAGPVRADGIIRAPFVTVQTGSVVVVRAPFVNIVVPAQPRVVTVLPPLAPPMPPPTSSLPPRDVVPTVDVPPGVTPPVVVLPSTDLTPVLPAPTPQTTGPGTPTPQVVRALTLPEFAASFRPLPGTHEVVFVHPATRALVKVRFTLPPGSPKAIRLQDRQVQFHYALGRNITLRFNPDGRVSVLE